MKLTNDIRTTIANNAIKESFKERDDALKKRHHDMGMKLYEILFPKDLRDKLKKIPDGWFGMDKCLKFNCAGYNLTFLVDEEVPVPRSYGCAVLGAITGAEAEEAQALAKESEVMRNEAKAAHRALSTMLASITSTKQLEQAWPEGKPFYQQYIVEKSKSGVPALTIDAVNKALGIKAEGRE